MNTTEINPILVQRMKVADILNVLHNSDGTEYYGMRDDSTAWMCVFHKHGTCIAAECVCDCHTES